MTVDVTEVVAPLVADELAASGRNGGPVLSIDYSYRHESSGGCWAFGPGKEFDGGVFAGAGGMFMGLDCSRECLGAKWLATVGGDGGGKEEPHHSAARSGKHVAATQEVSREGRVGSQGRGEKWGIHPHDDGVNLEALYESVESSGTTSKEGHWNASV